MHCWYKSRLSHAAAQAVFICRQSRTALPVFYSPCCQLRRRIMQTLPPCHLSWLHGAFAVFFSRPCHDRCLSHLDVCAAGRTVDRQPRRAGDLVVAATRYVCPARPAAGAEQHHRAKQRAAGARAAPRTGRNRPQHPARAGTGFQHIPNRAGTTQRRIGSHAGPAIARGTGRLGANAKAGVRHAQPAA